LADKREGEENKNPSSGRSGSLRIKTNRESWVFEMNITSFKETPKEKVKRVFQEYKLVLETQMHFNDMLMKYRSLAFTVILALGFGCFHS